MRPKTVISSFPPKDIGFPVLFDIEQGAACSAFRARRNPQTVLVGRDGIIAAIFFNAEYDTEFDDAIRKAINR